MWCVMSPQSPSRLEMSKTYRMRAECTRQSAEIFIKLNFTVMAELICIKKSHLHVMWIYFLNYAISGISDCINELYAKKTHIKCCITRLYSAYLKETGLCL